MPTWVDAVLNVWIEDALPAIYILVALDALVRDIRALRAPNQMTPKHKTMILIGTLLSGLLIVLYSLVLLQLDHAINPDPARFSALYVRPVMGLMIFYLNMNARNRNIKEIEHGTDPHTAPNITRR